MTIVGIEKNFRSKIDTSSQVHHLAS